MWFALEILFCLFLFIVAPLALIIGYLFFLVFGTWGAIFGFCFGLAIHLFGLRNLWAMQNLALMYLVYLLLVGIWPVLFVGLFFWMKHR